MRIEQVVLKAFPSDFAKLQSLEMVAPQLLLVFAGPAHFSTPALADELARRFPMAQRVGCSTAGEISVDGVENGSAVITAVHFKSSSFQVVSTELASMETSFQAGESLGQQLSGWSPKAVLVLGQGLNINGSAMIDGMVKQLGAALPIAGGLAGDDAAFQKTFTLCNDGISSTRLLAIGFKGDGLHFAHGSFGGWIPFGPVRKVTRSVNNVLYELDGEPALEVYKRYLGDHAKDLPGSGLLFPFEMLSDAREPSGLIRTILGVNDADGSLTLAGAISQNGYLRLMHAQTDGLVDGAEEAARATVKLMTRDGGAGLALLVSCVGRKLVMGGRVDEETEIVQKILGPQATLAGFYSYGEIGPGQGIQNCQLHNQTMTISYLTETPT
jgi:hypothetical protein